MRYGRESNPSCQNDGDATGNTPDDDRFRIVPCSPGSCSYFAAGCHGTCCPARWAAAPAVPVGGGWCAGNGRASGNGYIRSCSPNCGGAGNSIWPERWSTVPRSARCAGEKNWTEPYRSPQGRVEASCSHRRARVLTDAHGIPLVAQLTAANRNDITQLLMLV